MRTLHEQANDLAKDGQAIADELGPTTNGKKMSIKCIQHLIAQLTRRYAVLYVDIGEKDK